MAIKYGSKIGESFSELHNGEESKQCWLLCFCCVSAVFLLSAFSLGLLCAKMMRLGLYVLHLKLLPKRTINPGNLGSSKMLLLLLKNDYSLWLVKRSAIQNRILKWFTSTSLGLFANSPYHKNSFLLAIVA